jgi:hypothetical protein
MKAWLTVLLLVAATLQPALASPMSGLQAQSLSAAAQWFDQSLAEELLGEPAPVPAVAGLDVDPLALLDPSLLDHGLQPGQAHPEALPVTYTRLRPQDLREMDRTALMALAQSLPAEMRTERMAQALEQLRRLPREQRRDFALELLQDPSWEGELLEMAGELLSPEVLGETLWLEYGVALLAGLVAVLACRMPVRRGHGAKVRRMFHPA